VGIKTTYGDEREYANRDRDVFGGQVHTTGGELEDAGDGLLAKLPDDQVTAQF